MVLRSARHRMAADANLPTGVSTQAADSIAPWKQPERHVASIRFIAGNCRQWATQFQSDAVVCFWAIWIWFVSS